MKTFYSFVMIFWYCEYGERICSRFDEINDVIHQTDWYLLPVKMQKMIPTILIAAQRPVLLMGFGNVACTRENYKKVKFISVPNIKLVFMAILFFQIVNGGFSYFMIFREFQ